MGRVALVTGATRGIGLAIARELMDRGAEVIATGTAAQADGCPVTRYLQLDFLDKGSVAAFLTGILDLKIDILVNNAGINRVESFESLPSDDFERVLRVNLMGPFELCKAVLPGMRERGWGRIVNVGSIFGKISKERRAAYSASKFGLDGMTVALSAEYAQFGILANTVAPGFVDTELTRRVLGDAGIKTMVAGVPSRRLAKPEEIAELVAWLVSEQNSFLTGQCVAIDGGFSRV